MLIRILWIYPAINFSDLLTDSSTESNFDLIQEIQLKSYNLNVRKLHLPQILKMGPNPKYPNIVVKLFWGCGLKIVTRCQMRPSGKEWKHDLTFPAQSAIVCV